MRELSISVIKIMSWCGNLKIKNKNVDYVKKVKCAGINVINAN